MLHKLALVSSAQTPSLMKVAVPSPAEQLQQARDLELKARYMGRARGHKMPKMPAPQPSRGPLFQPVEGPAMKAYGGLLRERPTPMSQVEDIRMGTPTEKASPAFKKSPALIEKEIQKAHGPVAQSRMKQLRHKTLGKTKGWWGGRGLLGGKWRNRLALLGGAGAVGAGIKAYLDSNKTPQPELAPPVPQEQPIEGPEYLTYEDLYGYNYPKMSASKYSPDAVTIPKPTALPKVNPLGPGVSSTPTLKPEGTGSPLASTEPSESTSKSAGLLKRSDAGVLPLLGLGAGGLGGWALGKKVISPILESQENQLAARMKSLQKIRKAAPMGAAAAGALLLAALTAVFAKRQARGIPTRLTPYDQTNAGFMPENSTQLGQFYG